MSSPSRVKASSSKAASTTSNNPNQEIIAMLLEIGDYEKNVTRHFPKFKAYQKAAAALKLYNKPITSGEEAKKLDGVGAKIAKKIDEYLATGMMNAVSRVRSDDRNTMMKDLSRVSGIGPNFASKLISEGIRNLDDLRKHQEQLNHHQRIGLRYVTEFETRIPRSEMKQLEAVLLGEISRLDKNFKATVCGSYRRGAESSGDIDILVTHSKCEAVSKSDSGEFLDKIVKRLMETGFITDTLTQGDSMFMGVCQLSDALLKRVGQEPCSSAAGVTAESPPTKRLRRSTSTASAKPDAESGLANRYLHRRIDIRVVPADKYYCGLVHFTGSDIFNRRMRSLAIERGFSLTEYGVRKRGSTGVIGEPLPVNSEKDIFDYIGMPYCEPDLRIA